MSRSCGRQRASRHCPAEVAALASKRTYPLVSAFHPTYNMVVNLLAHSSRKATRKVLESSFAQFQADSSVVHLAQSARALEKDLDSLGEHVECSRGDAHEYFSMRDRLARLEKEASREHTSERRRQDQELFRSLKPGQVSILVLNVRPVDTLRLNFSISRACVPCSRLWEAMGVSIP